MNVFELFGKIAIDSSGAERSLDNTVGKAKESEGKLSKTFKKIGTAVAATFAVDKIVDFGKQCVNAYASIAAEESAFAQIMGDYAGTAQAKLNAVSEQTGVTSTRLTGAMTSLTAKFKGLGYGVEDATTLAADGLLIASDAAAFWDMSLDESMSHLNSFINGSYEGGEAIGLFANDTQMAAYAVEKGIVADAKAWASLDEATKQATRLDYAKNMQKQSGATGQAKKEASSYANVMANLKEHWRQFQGVVGKPILEKFVLPAMQKLEKIMPKVTEAVVNGIDWLSDGFDKVASYFSDVFTEDGFNVEAMPEAFENMFRDLGKALPGMLSSIGRTIRNGWANFVWPMIQGLFKATFGIELPKWSEIEKAVSDWWNGGMYQNVADACNWVLNLFGAPADVTATEVKTALNDWWTKTQPLVQDMCTWPLGLFTAPNETVDKIQKVISDWWATAGGWVASACNWVLGLFGAPALVKEEDVSGVMTTWWNKTVDFVQDVCNWHLKLFTNPVETTKQITDAVKGWWDGVVSTVQDACTWVLKLFDKPKAAADGVKNLVSGWWQGMKSSAEAALDWTLKLFKNPKEAAGDVATKVSTWWAGVQASVQSVLNWTLKLFSDPVETTAQVKTAVEDWWKGVKAGAESALEWTLGLFGAPDVPEDADLTTLLSTWWSSVKTGLANVCTWTLSLFNTPDEEGTKTAAKKIKDWFDSVITTAGDVFNVTVGVVGGAVATAQKTIKDWWSLVTSSLNLTFTPKPPTIIVDNGGGIRFGPANKDDSDTDDTNPPEGTYGPPAPDWFTNPDGTGAKNFIDNLFTRGSMLPGDENTQTGLLGVLAQTFANVKADITAAAKDGVADGLSGVTITATVSTGNMILDTGEIVGSITPRVDYQLGSTATHEGRA